ncbi:nickel pincer cofactor biosynthesis protein LarC [Streptomyces sp. NPDC055722]
MILWLNPVSGLSGDMGVGTLLALGAPLDEMRAIVASTGLSGWALDAERVMTGGLTATRAVVTVDDDAPSRRAAELLDIVRQARPEPVAALAARAISAIARVEARLHGEDARQVHLHEIGGLDTVVDTVAFAAGLHLLGITAVRSAPLTLGTGTVRTRHGVLPLPAPATVALLAEAQAQITGAAIDGETVTPTGAALLLAAAASYGPVPPMAVKAVGYGAGTRVVEDRPNVTQGLLGTPQASLSTEILLETNVDDVTGEVLGHLIRRALDAGAADAWVSAITMKKGRPAHTVHVLAPLHRMADLEEVIFTETGTLGLRRTAVDKVALERRTSVIDLRGHAIRVKHGVWGAKPEHEDVVAAAAALGRPAREVAQLALQSLQDQSDQR